MTTAKAKIEHATEDNEQGRETACTYATCEISGDIAGPIWGIGVNSVKRALSTLTEVCSCSAEFHEEL